MVSEWKTNKGSKDLCLIDLGGSDRSLKTHGVFNHGLSICKVHLDVSNHSSEEKLYFIPVAIPKNQLGSNEEDLIFFSTNKVNSRITGPLLDKVKGIFNIP